MAIISSGQITITDLSDGKDGSDSFTYFRYSSDSSGDNMTALPDEDSKFIGIATTSSNQAPTDASAYTWSRYNGMTVLQSTTEPTDKYTGMLWQYTGTSDLQATGLTAQQNLTYIWTGTAWQIYIIKSGNLQIDNAFITNAMINSIDASKIKADSLSAISANLGTITSGKINGIDPTDGSGFYLDSVQGYVRANQTTNTFAMLYDGAFHSLGKVTDLDGIGEAAIGANYLSVDVTPNSIVFGQHKNVYKENDSNGNPISDVLYGDQAAGHGTIYFDGTNFVFVNGNKGLVTSGSDIGWTPLTISQSGWTGNIRYCIRNGVVYLSISNLGASDTSAHGWTQIASLPSGSIAIPDANMVAAGFNGGGDCGAYVNSSGAIFIRNTGSIYKNSYPSTTMNATWSYPVFL